MLLTNQNRVPFLSANQMWNLKQNTISRAFCGDLPRFAISGHSKVNFLGLGSFLYWKHCGFVISLTWIGVQTSTSGIQPHLTCLFFSLTDVLGKENKEKDDKMNKFKQVALKAKKELENHKKQVCLCTRLLVDSMKIKL